MKVPTPEGIFDANVCGIERDAALVAVSHSGERVEFEIPISLVPDDLRFEGIAIAIAFRSGNVLEIAPRRPAPISTKTSAAMEEVLEWVPAL